MHDAWWRGSEAAGDATLGEKGDAPPFSKEGENERGRVSEEETLTSRQFLGLDWACWASTVF